MSYTPPPGPGGYGPPGPPGGYGGAPGYGPGGGFQPGYGYGYGQQDHPQGTTIMVLGICSLVFTFICGVGVFLGPVAWIMGNNALRDIDANPGRYGNRGNVNAGRICGIISTALLVLGILLVVVLVIAGATSSSSS